jgi:glycosyltransferase involved in cell wall biosynthesis
MVSTPWYSLPPPGYGGIEAMTAVLVDALVQAGHEVTVIGVGDCDTAGDFIATNDVAESGRVGAVGPEVLHAARAGDVLSLLDVDVVHDHSTAGPLQARMRAAPTVVTTHGPMSGECGDYYRAIDGTVHLVAISAAQQIQEPSLNWAGLVHNAVRTDDYPYAGRKQDYLVYLGRLAPEKGAHLAIDAARAAQVGVEFSTASTLMFRAAALLITRSTALQSRHPGAGSTAAQGTNTRMSVIPTDCSASSAVSISACE